MRRKVIFITGASRGLGHQIAISLAKMGHIVYAGMRNVHAIEHPNIIPIYCDMAKDSSFEPALNCIISAHAYLDVIIHNAGIAYIDAIEHIASDQYRSMFDINFFGPLRLTQLAIPQMQAQKNGQLLFISSIRATEGHAYEGLYSGSKAALEAAAFDLAATLKPWDIKISVIQIGPMKTGMNVLLGSNKRLPEYPNVFPPNPDLTWSSVHIVSETIAEICNAPTSSFRYHIGQCAQRKGHQHLVDPSNDRWLAEQQKWVQKIKNA